MGAVEVMAKAKELFVPVLMDEEDADALDGRRISIGSHGYAQMWNRPGVVLVHKWVMGVPTGTRYTVLVDHENRNKLDCRRSNLRLVTPTESNLNRHVAERELPRGVYLNRQGGFTARIKRARHQYHLGTFGTPEEAALVVETARAALDAGRFTHANGEQFSAEIRAA